MTRERSSLIVHVAAASLLAAAFLWGCGNDGGGTGAKNDAASTPEGGAFDAAILVPCKPDAGEPTVGDLPCDVGHVLTAKCQPCHQNPPKNHAHFSLLSYEDTQQPFGISGLRRWQRMSEVIEPGVTPHMPYGSAPQLTPEEFKVLRTWFHECAPPVPEGAGCDANGM